MPARRICGSPVKVQRPRPWHTQVLQRSDGRQPHTLKRVRARQRVPKAHWSNFTSCTPGARAKATREGSDQRKDSAGFSSPPGMPPFKAATIRALARAARRFPARTFSSSCPLKPGRPFGATADRRGPGKREPAGARRAREKDEQGVPNQTSFTTPDKIQLLSRRKTSANLKSWWGPCSMSMPRAACLRRRSSATRWPEPLNTSRHTRCWRARLSSRTNSV